MKKPLKFENASLCEYVAKGSGNKHTLVNVFSGDVIVSEMPAQMTFGIYVELVPEDIESPITIQITIDGNMIIELPPVDASELAQGRRMNIVVQSFPLRIDKDVTFEVIGSAPNRKRTTILSKRLYKGVIPHSS